MDDFYAHHRYDVMFLAHVYPYLRDRIKFMDTLRAYLKDDGVVVVDVPDAGSFTKIRDPKKFRFRSNLSKELVIYFFTKVLECTYLVR